MNRPAIDWIQLCYPGPKRAFTAQEMARAGQDAPSPTLVTIATINFACVAFVVLQLAPQGQTARLSAALVALAVLGSTTARWLWWRPWRRPLMMASMAVAAAMVLLAFGVRWRMPDPTERYGVVVTLAIGCSLLVVALWFLVVWRAQQIEGRLKEQAERERAIEMARRLAAAQVEPHFLFNSLASVQHWVQTQDARAAPMLDALVGYLRATLPMFDRPLHPVADELEVVRRYLEVMAARLGARLQWQIDVPAPLQSLAVPPGVLLTLVENAIEHGIEPKLAGGRLQVLGHTDAGRPGGVIEVRDDGAGLAADRRDGVGLTNCRERLALAYGDRAGLQLDHGASGGCSAALRLPAPEDAR
jgi:signal transduction histidine kinase